MNETPLFKLNSRAAAEGFTRAGENRGRPLNGFSKGQGLRNKPVAPEESGVMNFNQWRANILAQLHRDEIPFWELPDDTIVAEKLGRLSPKAQELYYNTYIKKQAEKLNRCNSIPA